MKNDIKIISVSEVGLYFGIWKDSQNRLKGKKIVVINRKNHRVVGAFQIIDIPVPIEEKCPCCDGTGKIEVKYGAEK